MFEFPQLVRTRCIHSFVRSFAHLFDHPSVFLCLRRLRLCVCTSVCITTCIQLSPTIFLDWALARLPLALLPSSFAYLTTKENSSVRMTRIAWFGLISSLNRDILQVQPSPSHLLLPLAECTSFHFALTTQHARTRNLFFIYFSRAIFWRETIKYIRFVFYMFRKCYARFLRDECLSRIIYTK